jgi:hypothetical protein
MEFVIKNSRSITYSPNVRHYLIDMGDGFHREFLCCPWCSEILPRSLDDEWFNILKGEYQLKDPIFDDADKVPAEFSTDEWWKKRGL